MARSIFCPSCGSKGSVPEEAQAARIRCPKCGQVFEVGPPSGIAQRAPAKKNPSGVQPRVPPPPAATPKSAYDDLEPVAPLPAISSSSPSRTAKPAARERARQSAPSPWSLLIASPSNIAVRVATAVACVIIFAVIAWIRLGPEGGEGPPKQAVSEPPPPPAPAVAARASDTSPAASSSAPDSSNTGGSSITSSVPSSAGDPQDVIRRVKDATVYIKIKVKNRMIGTGSGFVIETQGNTVILATNRHVAIPDLDELPERIAPAGSVTSLEVVFRSGLGSQEEQSVPASVIAADLSGDLGSDLAFLVAQGVKRPPQPINPLARLDPSEGMTYIGAGFPLGGLMNKIAETKGNPSVTITGGRIAAVRRDEGRIALLQVDGSIQGGNSGGPIVDEKSGRLVGVAVANLEPLGISTIGFIVPAEELRRCLAGRVGALDLTLKDSPQGTAELQVKAQVVDPKRAVQGVMLHIAPASSVGTVSPNADGSWPQLPNSTAVELQRDARTPFASGHVKVTLSGQGAAARKVLIQTAHRDFRGTLVYSRPKEYVLPEKPGRIRPPGALERIVKVARRKSAALLGPLVNPENDCHLTKDDDNYKISIEIPGGKVHSLSPYIVTRANKKKPLHNAPMTLAEVEGDFVALVEVTGEISAGSTLPKDRQGNTIPFTFQGAGLILYQDKNNFVRLERTAGVSLSDLQTIHKALIEIVKDGTQLRDTDVYWPLTEGDVQLILIRRKGKVRFQFRPSGSNVTYASREFELDLPKKVKIGLAAGNISAKPFTAHFENFAIISNSTVIDEEFGDSAAK